jgi:LysR family cys regulon transcriptional activator
MFLRGYMYRFMELFAPHLNRDTVDKVAASSQEEVDTLFRGMQLPER